MAIQNQKDNISDALLQERLPYLAPQINVAACAALIKGGSDGPLESTHGAFGS